MKRSICAACAVMLSLVMAFSAVADTNLSPEIYEGGIITDESWTYYGYTYGGIGFAVPAECYMYDLTAAEMNAGVILLLGNDDFMLQLRGFEPEQQTYEQFKQKVLETPSAETNIRDINGTEVLTYKNTRATASSELYGIVMTGIDGKMYKVSIFTGDNERFDAEAPVWKIAEIVGATCNVMDYSSFISD